MVFKLFPLASDKNEEEGGIVVYVDVSLELINSVGGVFGLLLLGGLLVQIRLDSLENVVGDEFLRRFGLLLHDRGVTVSVEGGDDAAYGSGRHRQHSTDLWERVDRLRVVCHGAVSQCDDQEPGGLGVTASDVSAGSHPRLFLLRRLTKWLLKHFDELLCGGDAMLLGELGERNRLLFDFDHLIIINFKITLFFDLRQINLTLIELIN